MKALRTFLSILALAALLAPLRAQDVIEDRIALLMIEMSLEEKVGQMTQLNLGALSKSSGDAANPDGHQIDPEKLREAIVEKHIGSILNTEAIAFPAAYWQEVLTQIQDLATKETRHKIPIVYGIASVHGANYIREGTLFPHSLSLAATCNPTLVEQCYAVCARETRAAGLPWNFAPVLDVARQPLWPRFFETFGEDVYLASVYSEAAVRGLQGDDISSNERVAATGKHFLGSSFPFTGRDRTQTLLPDRYLREYFLPPFQRAMDNANLQTIMVNSGEINGIPVHANRSILTTLLRDQLGFQGVVITDWEDVRKLHELHRIAPNEKEAVRLAVEAGIDMCMAPSDYHFTDHLVELVEEGSVPEQLIDESCRRILRLKFDLGLFDDPYPKAELLTAIGTAEAKQLTLEAARESLVLLKNDGSLPFKKGTKILLTGPGCASRAALHGAWSYTWQGKEEAAYPPEIPTVVQAFEAAHGKDNISYVPGVEWNGRVDYDRAVRNAQQADLIVCILAEEPSTETAGNIDDLALPEAQRRLVRELSFGKPLVLVLLENRPRLITDINGLASAVVFAGYPGPAGGPALYDLLSGAVNPSGKLPFTYPSSPNHFLPYDHKWSDTVDDKAGHEGFQPLYEFGHGLSYTTFQVDSLDLAHEELTLADSLQVSVALTNTGPRAGSEVLHVFVRDLYASITPPVKRLRAFRKVHLEAGATETVTFDIPVMELGFYGVASKRLPIPTVEPGEFEVSIGGQKASFTVR